MYAVTPCPESEGGIYTGFCSFGLKILLGGLVATADAGGVYDPDESMPWLCVGGK